MYVYIYIVVNNISSYIHGNKIQYTDNDTYIFIDG